MANETYTLIRKTTLNADAASITFSSIPQTFTDLTLVLSLRTTGVGGSVGSIGQITFNSSTSGYSEKDVYGQQGSAGSGAYSSITTYIPTGRDNNALLTASTFSSCSVYIPNYTSANFKSVSLDSASESNSTNTSMALIAGLWSNTAAINAITITSGDGNYVQYSSASLYGVAKQGVTPTGIPKASGGDIITNDGTYWIHQFLTSGTFTPSSTLSCDYLVVAGGAGGGQIGGGGGGAGGFKTSIGNSPLSVTAQSYAITVGAGGSAPSGGGANQNTKGSNGSNSVFSSITSTGGGGGGAYMNAFTTGLDGGSGGGGGTNDVTGSTTTPGAASPSGQGNAGGAGSNVGNGAGGGGGGAGAAGGAGSSSTGGAGGNGLASSITGSSVYYSGGGGAGEVSGSNIGLGGLGGGGNAVFNNNGIAGTVNSGGGGGGGSFNSPAGTYMAGGAGGSGIVIIRYAM